MADVKQVKDAQLGLDLQAQQVGVVVQRHLLAVGSHVNRQCMLGQLGVVDKQGRNRVAIGNGAIEPDDDVGTFQGQVGVGADQSGFVGAGFQAVEIHAWHGKARCLGRCHHGQDKIQVIDGKSDGISFRTAGNQLAVCVSRDGAVRAVIARKSLHAHTGHYQRIGRGHHLDTGQVETDTVQRALLESKTALQADNARHAGRSKSHGGFNPFGIEVKQDGRAAGLDRAASHGCALGKVGNHAVLALVDGDAHVLQVKLDEVAKAHKADALGMGFQGCELGAFGNQRFCGVELRGEDAQAEIEIADLQADGVVRKIIGVNHAAAIDVCGRSVDADESVDVVGAYIDAVDLDIAGDL